MKITINTTEFEFSHGRKPRGYGGWIFELTFKKDYDSSEPIEYIPEQSSTFTDAAKAAKNHARMSVKTYKQVFGYEVDQVDINVLP